MSNHVPCLNGNKDFYRLCRAVAAMEVISIAEEMCPQRMRDAENDVRTIARVCAHKQGMPVTWWINKAEQYNATERTTP